MGSTSLRLALATVTCGVLMFTGAPPAQADIYEYVDANGVAHYTNVPTPGKKWRRITRRAQVRRRTARMPRDLSPERLVRFDPYIREAADMYQLPESFIRAVMHIESNFDPNVVSVDGAMGLMQLMPRTAASMGVTDPFDPRQNILGGARYLRVLANQFNGDLVLTVAGYNAGGGAVQRYNGVPPYRETRRYVNRVLKKYYSYRAAPRS